MLNTIKTRIFHFVHGGPYEIVPWHTTDRYMVWDTSQQGSVLGNASWDECQKVINALEARQQKRQPSPFD